MTRKKKTRKTGPLAASKKPRDEVQRKAPEGTKHKGKGHKPGSRFNPQQEAPKSGTSQPVGDSRFGSKKPITLVNTHAQQVAAQPSFDRAAAEAELQALENDARLQALLDRIDNGDELNPSEERYVDERTERFEQLAELLGLNFDDDEDDDDE
ncbi:Der GTPase-activating protein YihI [Pseudidiomarina salilacus]|uniref:Der GTPase-activating protein YihI n=1 Tax=Pseudidiomarina salilacus TaxID=3384452 RepID=UPI00398489A5